MNETKRGPLFNKTELAMTFFFTSLSMHLYPFSVIVFELHANELPGWWCDYFSKIMKHCVVQYHLKIEN